MKIVKILNLDFGAHVVFLLSQNWMALNFHCFLIMSRGLSKIIYVKLSFLDTSNLGWKSPLFYFELPHEDPLFPNFYDPSKEGKPDWDGWICVTPCSLLSFSTGTKIMIGQFWLVYIVGLYCTHRVWSVLQVAVLVLHDAWSDPRGLIIR